MSCGPWIINNDFSIFCDFNESIPKGIYNIRFYNIAFNYSGIVVSIKRNEYDDIRFEIIKENFDMIN